MAPFPAFAYRRAALLTSSGCTPVDAAVSSRIHGKIKPDPSIFRAALERLSVEPDEALMVGDQPEDDVEGARSIGMEALLLDREDRFPEIPDRLRDLYALPAALGLSRARG